MWIFVGEVYVGALRTVYLWSLPISQHKTIPLDGGMIFLKTNVLVSRQCRFCNPQQITDSPLAAWIAAVHLRVVFSQINTDLSVHREYGFGGPTENTDLRYLQRLVFQRLEDALILPKILNPGLMSRETLFRRSGSGVKIGFLYRRNVHNLRANCVSRRSENTGSW